MNRRGHFLECSHFEPYDEERVADSLPVVIYLHGNCSSRLEALACVPILLPANITLFTMDLSGSGLSEGEFISLGWYERDDVELVVEFLRASQRASTIGLWGRSMGAVTSLLHGDRDPSIGGMVLDSPFTNLKSLSQELSRMHTKIPKWVGNMGISILKRTIKKKAGFDITNLSPIDHVDRCFIPAFFAAACDDSFILPHHA